jgi:two-component system phosphate regulon sensor histidine kinase PhoR
LKWAPQSDAPVARANEDGVRTIVNNLISNAIHYTPAGGSVTVSTWAEDLTVVIQIADTGIGIAPDHQARIFERFYRVDKARSRDMGGTGLGLSIVKHLTQAFGGSVHLKSSVGKGSTFRIHLPRYDSAPLVPSADRRNWNKVGS